MSEPVATYDPSLSTEKDIVRFKVGDIDVTTNADGRTNALRPDVEYLAVLDLHGDWRLATADMAESLASQYAQEPDSFTATGDMSVSWKERVKQWQWLASQMRSAVAAEDAALIAAASLVSVRPVRAWVDSGEYRSPYLRRGGVELHGRFE
jgi:hypothetical protein